MRLEPRSWLAFSDVADQSERRTKFLPISDDLLDEDTAPIPHMIVILRQLARIWRAHAEWTAGSSLRESRAQRCVPDSP